MANIDNLAENADLPKIKEISIKSTTRTYREYGSGYPVICFPAWMTTSYVFQPLAKSLKTDYGSRIKLICPDMPGWTNRMELGHNKSSIDLYTEIAAEFVNSLKIENYSILGYSYGGIVLQSMLSSNLVTPQKNLLISTLNGGFDIFREAEVNYLMNNAPRIRKLINNEEAIKKAYIFIKKAFIGFTYLDTENLLYVDNLLKDIGEISIENALSSIYSLYGRTFISPNLKKHDLLLLRSEKDHKSVIKGMTEISKYTGKRVNVLPNLNHHHLVFKPSASKIHITSYLRDLI